MSIEKLDHYQALADQTMAHDLDEWQALATLGLGIAGEAGEVADLVKKIIGHGHPLDMAKMTKELGDVLWYVATLSRHLGLSLQFVAEANIEKLRARYPDGFTTERSMNRDPEHDRA